MTQDQSQRTRPRSADEVQAHRGASAIAPENTIAAFRAACDEGARWVELDVALMADGVPVVIHDPTLDRTTTAKGSVGNIRSADLRTIDAGGWFDGRFAGERLPTLAETVAAAGELGLGLNVEIKQHPHHRSLTDLTQAVHRELEKRNSNTRIMISSFDPACLSGMKAIDPSYDVAMLWDQVPPNWREALAAIPARAVHLNYRALSFGFLEAAKKEGIIVRAWTCNDPEMMAPFWAWGLGGVISDNPKLFL